MKRPLRGDMPLALKLPLHFDLGLRPRRRRLRRFLIAALALAVLVAAGAWLPARAALDTSMHDLAVGDSFTLERPDGVVLMYEVIALDIVDSDRVEIEPDADGRIVALATPWPFDSTAVGGQWHYVVTGRLRF